MAHAAFPIDWMLSQEAVLKHSLMIPGTSGYKISFYHLPYTPPFFPVTKPLKRVGRRKERPPEIN